MILLPCLVGIRANKRFAEERRKMEQDDRNKSDRRRREEVRENAEIEREFARQRAALLG